MNLYKKKHNYVAKDGKEKTGWNFYVEHNGNFVAVRPSFPEDARVLATLAIEVVEDK